MFSGYEAVDALVAKCEELSKPLESEMAKWGLNTFGGRKEGDGLELVSFEDDAESQRDSGVGSPSKGVDDDKIVSAKRRKTAVNFLKKPELMAESFVLEDYQIVGLNRLILVYNQNLSYILADDMGLGKTCQVISFLSHLVGTGHHGPHVVFGPAAVFWNWCQEFVKFPSKLAIQPYHGQVSERVALTEEVLEKKYQVINHLPTKTCPVKRCSPFHHKNEHTDAARKRARKPLEGVKITAPKSDENNPIMQLCKAAIHPLLFRRHFTDEKIGKMADLLRKKELTNFNPNEKRYHLIDEMRKASDFYLHTWCMFYPCIKSFDVKKNAWMDSGKVAALDELVKKYKENGERVLTFSQFLLVLGILEAVLNSSSITYTRIDGSTKIDERRGNRNQSDSLPSMDGSKLRTTCKPSTVLTESGKLAILRLLDLSLEVRSKRLSGRWGEANSYWMVEWRMRRKRLLECVTMTHEEAAAIVEGKPEEETAKNKA
ncbi:snf2 family helicase atpase protein [Rutstroemia sp. NJR-2017a WRK4]|nr:snf2 family helicase atpase protein [Rutstroemia sp. NJR-2017a WRK4]